MVTVPAPLASLQQWLEENDFSLVLQQKGPGFGDQVLEYERDDVAVRIVADRGQWFVDVAAAGGEWFDLDLWRSCLEKNDEAMGPESVEDLTPRVGAIRRALRSEHADALVRCLRSAARERARRSGR